MAQRISIGFHSSPPLALRVSDKELAKLSVPLGLLSGLIAGWAYNRWSDMRLPSYLAFFGGRRFVPIVCGFVGLALGLLFGVAWPGVEHGMDVTSQAVLGSESLGLFTYGVLNRVRRGHQQGRHALDGTAEPGFVGHGAILAQEAVSG